MKIDMIEEMMTTDTREEGINRRCEHLAKEHLQDAYAFILYDLKMFRSLQSLFYWRG